MKLRLTLRCAAQGLAALLAAAALGACTPTQGDDGRFDPVSTTNADFGPARTFAVGNLPVTVDITTTAGGVVDLVAVANSLNDPALNPAGGAVSAGSVTILRNDGQGTFSVIASLLTEAGTLAARWVNLDDLGDVDLVVLDGDGERLATYVAPGTADWPATPSQTFAVGAAAAQLEVVDFDGSGGVQDLLVSVPFTNTMLSLVNAGDGSGTLVEVTTAITAPARFIAANFNAADTFADLALLSKVGSRVELWGGAGDGTFAQTLPTTSIGVTPTPGSLVAGHLAGYSSTDLAVLSALSGQDFSTLTVIVNDGEGSFAIDRALSIPDRAHDLFVVDLVPDSPPLDFVAMHSSRRYVSLVTSGSAGYANSTHETTRNPIAAVSGDVTGDGLPDLVTTEGDKRAVGVFAGDGTGALTRTQIGFTTKLVLPRLVHVNGDGRLDLMLLQPNADRLAVLLNQH